MKNLLYVSNKVAEEILEKMLGYILSDDDDIVLHFTDSSDGYWVTVGDLRFHVTGHSLFFYDSNSPDKANYTYAWYTPIVFWSKPRKLLKKIMKILDAAKPVSKVLTEEDILEKMEINAKGQGR